MTAVGEMVPTRLFCGLERLCGIRIVDRNLFVEINDFSTFVAVDPFKRITGQAFAGFPSKTKL